MREWHHAILCFGFGTRLPSHALLIYTPDTQRRRREEGGIGYRCFISACKVRPVPYGLSKAGPFGFRGKIILAALAVFFPKALHNPARNGGAGKK